MLVVSKLRPAEQLRPTETDAGVLLLELVKTFADHRPTQDIDEIARAMVEAHAGTRTVASELGKGSVFTTSLPLVLP
jgi:hypothetical protein